MDHLRGHLTSKWSAVKSVSPTSVEPSWLCLETVWLRSNLYSRDGLVWRSVGGRLLALYPSPTHAAVGSEAPLKPLSLARQVCMGDAGGSEERTASLRTQLRRAAADVPLLKMKMRRLPSTPPASPPPRVCVHHVSVDQALGTPGAEGACASTNPRGVTERPRSVTPRRNHSVRLAADSRGAVRGPGRLSFSLDWDRRLHLC